MNPQQRMDALSIANTTRLAGAEVRREIQTGQLAAADALFDSRAQFMPLGRLLTAQNQWGPAKVSSLLMPMHIWPAKRVRDLTERQRNLLAEKLR